jgi:hypothetical protein
VEENLNWVAVCRVGLRVLTMSLILGLVAVPLATDAQSTAKSYRVGLHARADKATITVALGMTPEQVREGSTTSIPWSLGAIDQKQKRAGGALITTPHRLVYQDQALRVVFPDAANRLSMPTTFVVTGDSVRTVSVSALGEYVDLKTAVAESRRLFDELKSQAFDYAERDAATGGYAKFYLARGNVLTNPRPPRTVNSFQEMEAIFLDSRLYLEEFLVFAMRKADLEVTLRVTNMRRRHTENQMATTGRTPSIQDRAAEEARAFDRTRLEKEHVYYLEVFIGRPLGSLQAR